ncbi:hypothetical protein [Gordonia sp. (in: high G+C Gram-positive bacteria)]|uniref:hypothetical protein n=1 Tax=Gordonia sp. (in: high G+C Gram-positive bacteria) TaxID=84139 RepID=UPI001D725134|nr:hypothetical protein [Gordonia sp. (in: high G+C Gram-positive bacteria)]MCB1297084.1 hypothetical protein [Gordonia sp. (in: high G+C Gram-positive bacteria)]HMS74150.1 hypothetical protein [Gordonia sp. (in: high G+C Gram-positive bacteria)]HQV17381.1 hypothetical protein [Gordonia sp. (in: high G+C Gram-positive bacteria)]
MTAIDLVGTVPPTAGARLEVLRVDRTFIEVHSSPGRGSVSAQIVLTADQVAELIVALGGVVPKVGA